MKTNYFTSFTTHKHKDDKDDDTNNKDNNYHKVKR